MRRKILVVDDNETNRCILSEILGETYDVLEAEDGKAALQIMHQSYMTISAVLLDLAMPVMDGFEVLNRMQNNPMFSRIPVLVTTGSRDEETEVRALSLGANDFITKPYNPELLALRLKNAIHIFEKASFYSALQKDPLTGIYNQKTFFTTAAGMIKAHESGYYVMACFDVDRFKVINDQYGRKKGDEVLKRIAGILDRGFSGVGGICSRITADDFAVLYPRRLMDSETLEEIRDRISTSDGELQQINFSIGRYVVDDPSLPVSGMYDRALLAQAAAKGSFDRNIVLYDESMRDLLLHEQEIVRDMKHALETGQFEAWLQPQYNHATGALIGAEALVRWRSPKGGIIAPDDFVPVFERNGFIYEMDKYVWEQSCLLLRKWADAGLSPLPISVNVSRHDVLREDFMETLTGLLEKYGLPVGLLRIEITESAFSEASGQIVQAVKSLIDYGFTVEIDDFGSGYSSLNTLKDVPAQVLKLDMRFLENSEDSGRGGNVLESVVRMAKWLGMAVVAEGVETAAQADYLKSIGCTYVQGYLYAKPMPSCEYEALFAGAGREEALEALETVKNLDNNSFWDIRSMDTLIFNSYVGAACIIERSSARVELLRVSETFMQMLGSVSMTVEDAMMLDWRAHCAEDSRCAMTAAIQKSAEAGGDVTGEYLFLKLPGCPEKTFLRITLRVIASTGDSQMIYCLNENITAQKELEERERASAVQLQAIMENINGGVYVAVLIGGEPHIQFANGLFYQQRGYTKEQYEAEKPRAITLIHEDDRERTLVKYRNAGSRPFSAVYRLVRRDGAVRWMQNNVTIVSLPGFDGPVYLSVTNDITELREAERKEHEVSERLQGTGLL